MLIYEVNLYIDGNAAEEMAVWLKDHIREMLAFDGFEGATWYFRDPEAGRQCWTTHYQVRSWNTSTIISKTTPRRCVRMDGIGLVENFRQTGACSTNGNDLIVKMS